MDVIFEEIKSRIEGLSVTDLSEITGLHKRTIQRRLKKLISDDRITPIGKGPARYYVLKKHDPSIYWKEAFLFEYEPNNTFYLSEDIRKALAILGAPGATLPAGTYARGILNRLLIDLSWNSSRLEGNTYTLLDTEELFNRGFLEGGSDSETQMIWNHKAAIEYLVDCAEDIDFSPIVIRSLHALLSENLLRDRSSSGRLRQIPVRISGTKYVPLKEPQRIENAFTIFCEKANTIKDPFEASFFAQIHLPYLQPFVDVNKRVSRLAANIPFIRTNHYPLSFLEMDRTAYLRAVLDVYENQTTSPLETLFVDAYQRSAQKYALIAQSLGDPDPIRMRLRTEIKKAIRFVILTSLTKEELPNLPQLADVKIHESDNADFYRIIREELPSLHEGNIVQYRIGQKEFKKWRTEYFGTSS